MKPGDVLGRYQVVSRLARGGMAEVWKARIMGEGGFSKDVVLKTILPHLAENPEFEQMFVNEALVAARLNHPNLVQIFDFGKKDSQFFLAMEFVSGVTFRQVKQELRKRRLKMPTWFVARAIIDVCEGLHYAHELVDEEGKPLNIIHRDISPDNIMVSRAGMVKVLDFGVAKASLDANVTKAGTLKGKYAYMSPEQIAGDELDRRVDVYAMGITLYELLSGRRPYKGKNQLQLLREVIDANPERLSKVAPHVSKSMEQIVARAMHPDRDKRFATARMLSDALRDYLDKKLRDRHDRRSMAKFVTDMFPVAAPAPVPRKKEPVVPERPTVPRPEHVEAKPTRPPDSLSPNNRPTIPASQAAKGRVASPSPRKGAKGGASKSDPASRESTTPSKSTDSSPSLVIEIRTSDILEAAAVGEKAADTNKDTSSGDKAADARKAAEVEPSSATSATSLVEEVLSGRLTPSRGTKLTRTSDRKDRDSSSGKREPPSWLASTGSNRVSSTGGEAKKPPSWLSSSSASKLDRKTPPSWLSSTGGTKLPASEDEAPAWLAKSGQHRTKASDSWSDEWEIGFRESDGAVDGADSGDHQSGARVRPSEEHVKAEALFDQGLVFVRRGETQLAIDAWEKALELDPNNRRYLFNLRKLREKKSSGDK